jgi:hypothetical protein
MTVMTGFCAKKKDDKNIVLEKKTAKEVKPR